MYYYKEGANKNDISSLAMLSVIYSTSGEFYNIDNAIKCWNKMFSKLNYDGDRKYKSEYANGTPLHAFKSYILYAVANNIDFSTNNAINKVKLSIAFRFEEEIKLMINNNTSPYNNIEIKEKAIRYLRSI